MLGLIGLLGALFASVLADSMFSQYDEDDGEAAENGCVSIVVEILLRRPPSGLICA